MYKPESENAEDGMQDLRGSVEPRVREAVNDIPPESTIEGKGLVLDQSKSDTTEQAVVDDAQLHLITKDDHKSNEYQRPIKKKHPKRKNRNPKFANISEATMMAAVSVNASFMTGKLKYSTIKPTKMQLADPD